MPGKSQSPPVDRRLLTGGVVFEKSSSSAATLLPVQLLVDRAAFTCKALIDSGAEGNFLDHKTALQFGVPVVPLNSPIFVTALCGQSLPPVTHVTESVSLITSGNHTETISFLLTDSPLAPVVLGHPWLSRHNPNINWRQNTVSSWSEYCHASCLLSACPSVSCSVLQDEHMDLSNVPAEYLDLKGVFSKSRAASLPPHRPYDCAIELLSGMSPPKGRLYSLSTPEREAMEKYISDSLAAKIIRPSSSPAGAGFFFVEKKDGSLRPCIDYRGLNSITVKNTYPLPLMSSAFESLQGASFFTKLDLRNAYYLVRIREGDEWKTAFNTPRGHFEYLVMPFGLSNAPAVFQALVNDVLRDMVDQFIYVYLDDILIFFSVSPGTCSARQGSASEAAREWAFCQGGEMRFSCTVGPFFRLHCVVRGNAHGPRQGSGCGKLANPRFPQGPEEVPGLCQFLPAFYSQLQPASRPFDCLDLH